MLFVKKQVINTLPDTDLNTELEIYNLLKGTPENLYEDKKSEFELFKLGYPKKYIRKLINNVRKCEKNISRLMGSNPTLTETEILNEIKCDYIAKEILLNDIVQWWDGDPNTTKTWSDFQQFFNQDEII